MFMGEKGDQIPFLYEAINLRCQNGVLKLKFTSPWKGQFKYCLFLCYN